MCERGGEGAERNSKRREASPRTARGRRRPEHGCWHHTGAAQSRETSAKARQQQRRSREGGRGRGRRRERERKRERERECFFFFFFLFFSLSLTKSKKGTTTNMCVCVCVCVYVCVMEEYAERTTKRGPKGVYAVVVGEATPTSADIASSPSRAASAPAQ